MKRFTSSIRKSVQDGNFFGALFVALAMPDICGALEEPNREVGERYRSWFQRYLRAKYDPATQLEFMTATLPQALDLPPEAKTALNVPFDSRLAFTADDCYRCRCKCLHEGVLKKTNQEKFIFLSGLPTGTILHRDLKDGQLVLQIELFSEDMCLGVEAWERDTKGNSLVEEKRLELLSVTEWYNL
jgi:hypothetical protein